LLSLQLIKILDNLLPDNYKEYYNCLVDSNAKAVLMEQIVHEGADTSAFQLRL
jgi:hypothetical protein